VNGLLQWTVDALGNRIDRRSFLGRAAVVGSAVVTAPLEFGLRPRSAYAAVCNCSGSACPCGSTCCDGYTEFCCTLNGVNACPGGTITAGWWKVDGSAFCGGAARYYLDCNAVCGPCACGNGTCSGACAGVGCGCAGANCDNRKAGCTRFRYGQCNQDVACVGPIVCRVVTCAAPWSFDPACGTSSRTDEATRYHDRPCLDDPWGVLDQVIDVGGAIRLTGFAAANSDFATADVRIFLDNGFVLEQTADGPRPDVKVAYPDVSANTGFDCTIRVSAGPHLVCAWAVDVHNGRTSLIGLRQIEVAGPFGAVDRVQDVGGAIHMTGWTIANAARAAAGLRVFVDLKVVYDQATDQPRPDVQHAFPGAPADTGFDVTIPAAPGTHSVCVWGVDRSNGSIGPLFIRDVHVSPAPPVPPTTTVPPTTVPPAIPAGVPKP
jgi:hypothetical protein